jgi:hypothetical protein
MSTLLTRLTTFALITAAAPAFAAGEYAQTANLTLTPYNVTIDMTLTPGKAVADRLIDEIDRDADGKISRQESDAYGMDVRRGLTVELDGYRLSVNLVTISMPEVDALRRGTGTITLQLFADLPRSAYGYYKLVFHNGHEPVTSRYEATVHTDGSARLKILGQHLIDRQRELTVEFSVAEDAGYSERNRT